MKRSALVVGTCLAGLAAAATLSAQQPAPHSTSGGGVYHQAPVTVGVGTVAKATLAGGDAKLSGTVTLTQAVNGVRVVVDVAGAKPGKHGLEIHEHGVCVAPYTSAGHTLNIYNMSHGCPPSPSRELGSLGNIEIGAAGTGHLDKVIDKISLVDSAHIVIGKSILFQAGEDDCKTAPNGSSGSAIACGVIVKQ